MKKAILGCAFAAALVNASNALAGGLWLNEFGDFSGGRASAGASAGTDDAATIAHNPASSSRMGGDQLFVSADAYLGGFAGAGLDYDNNWAGRYNATDVDIQLLILGLTAACEVTDRLSLGASLQGWYSNLEQKVAVPRLDSNREDARAKLDGDDTGAGFTLGALYELDKRTRFGAFYQSELKIKYDGDLKIKGLDGPIIPRDQLEVSTDTELDMAQYVRLSMHHGLDETWGVNFTWIL